MLRHSAYCVINSCEHLSHINRYSEAMNLRNIFFFLVLALLPACSSVSTYKTSPIDTAHSPTALIRILNDTENLSNNLSERLNALGFRTTKDAGRADYFVDVQYSTFFDVVHQTFNHFDISIVDAKTNEQKIHLRYVGRIGFNGCNAALDLVFKDLSRQLKNGR
jgi:hypothetical protein